jgi:hypothetical protein
VRELALCIEQRLVYELDGVRPRPEEDRLLMSVVVLPSMDC